MFNEKDLVAVNTLRALSVEQVEKANSGHPGLPMGAAPMAYALWAGHLNVNPELSDWPNRDRFVLSAGHGSALLYSLLHMSGFDVTIDDLKDFRQVESRTPGHPEYRHTDGVEATTGPLGQGIAQAVGMAMAEQHTAAIYNTDEHKVIDHYTYTLVGDGDLMEGISYEAISFAGRQQLDKLIVLYDSNDISLDGDLDKAFNEDIKGRFESANWNYLRVEEGTDLDAISNAIQEAKDNKGKPTLIEIKTVIGYGSPQQGTADTHGNPLGAENWEATRKVYGWDHDPFDVPAESKALFDEKVKARGKEAYEAWLETFNAYKEANPEKAEAFEQGFNGHLAEDYDAKLEYQAADAKAEASRASSGKAIQALAETVPYLWGGSADLSGSNKTMIDSDVDFMPEDRAGRNIWFGVREFAMAAMLNGIALHGGTKVYGGTFFVFTDYLKAAVRLSAISQLPVTYVMTHDSVAVGEDGPTHEPIEQLAAFRAMPNLNLIRPADVNETFAAWKIAVESSDRPTMLVLSRQNLPVLEGSDTKAEEGVRKGGYVISSSEGETPEGILIATGSEVSLAVEAQAKLKEQGVDVSVVSLPAQNLFDEQSAEYKESVLPKAVRNRMSIEMGATFGWERYVGLDGVTLGIDRFGASGKGEEVIEYFGFTAENVVSKYTEAFGK
ncbi:transketolase [Ruoffia tabacinasalis]|uniref:Transketolase n=1 Tax=Ruoffia tabacinasalis TaxID=87458 RepID=A0ABS0LKU2_9LACT|nr:transketolase [Ruoffia tabacinasalis]MBG9978843.1 transketolase [Ruoffia tabacinasalis]